MYYPYTKVQVRKLNSTEEFVILYAYEYLDKENEYIITTNISDKFKESELIFLVPESYRYHRKCFKNELDLGEYVISSVDHKKTFGRIIGKKYNYRNTRIQYILDNGYFFYGSQLRIAKGGV